MRNPLQNLALKLENIKIARIFQKILRNLFAILLFIIVFARKSVRTNEAIHLIVNILESAEFVKDSNDSAESAKDFIFELPRLDCVKPRNDDSLSSLRGQRPKQPKKDSIKSSDF